jgi:hypothetical protein
VDVWIIQNFQSASGSQYKFEVFGAEGCKSICSFFVGGHGGYCSGSQSKADLTAVEAGEENPATL